MTIVELLVVIGIFTIISVIIIFDYGKFRSTSSLQNLADDIALSVRKAQSFAIGVRGTNNDFSPGYGVHFSIDPVSDAYSGTNRSFILFANISNLLNYDNNGLCGINNLNVGNECLEELAVTSSDKITSIIYNDGSEKTLVIGDTIDIFFQRPNPEPTFCYKESGNIESLSCDAENISSVKIIIKNDANPGYVKTITIYNNGQISVT